MYMYTIFSNGGFEVGLSELKGTVENMRPPIGKVAPRSRR